jgi:hypothetical protein
MGNTFLAIFVSSLYNISRNNARGIGKMWEKKGRDGKNSE